MRARYRLLAAALGPALFCAAAAPTPNEMPVFGVFSGGYLYAGLKLPIKHDELVRETFPRSVVDRRQADVKKSLAYSFPHWSDFYGILLGVGPFREKMKPEQYGLRWHIDRDTLWYIGHFSAGTNHFPLLRLPLDRVSFSDDPRSGAMTDSLKLPRGIWPPPKPTPEAPQGTNLVRDGSSYFPWVSTNSWPLSSGACQERSARFDIYPESARSCLAFVSVQPGRIEQAFIPRLAEPTMFVFRYRFDAFHDGPTDQMCWAGLWSEADRFPVMSLEPFRAVVNPDSYLFATQTGQLYQIPRKREKDRRMQLAWDTASRKPIVAMLEDADAGKSYAFTTKSFFEIGPKIAPQLCDIGPADEIKPEDPLPTLRRCAQTLLQRGLIKPPGAGTPRTPQEAK